MKKSQAVFFLFTVSLAGCSPTLSVEAACVELGSYAEELRFSADNLISSLSEEGARKVYAQNMSEIAEEVLLLQIGDRELAEASQKWAESIQTFGTLLSVDQEVLLGGSYVDQISGDLATMDNNTARLVRLCR